MAAQPAGVSTTSPSLVSSAHLLYKAKEVSALWYLQSVMGWWESVCFHRRSQGPLRFEEGRDDLGCTHSSAVPFPPAEIQAAFSLHCFAFVCSLPKMPQNHRILVSASSQPWPACSHGAQAAAEAAGGQAMLRSFSGFACVTAWLGTAPPGSIHPSLVSPPACVFGSFPKKALSCFSGSEPSFLMESSRDNGQ